MSEKESIASRFTGSLSRRDFLSRFAAAAVAAGNFTFHPLAARHVHRIVSQGKRATGQYVPQFFKEREYRMLGRLAELILPADEHSGSAVDAGAPEFIDLLCSQNSELADIYTGGMLWINREAKERFEVPFLEAKEEQQVHILERLDQESRRTEALRTADGAMIFRENANFGAFRDYRSTPDGEMAQGTRFFTWLRRMTLDAFYTSEIGIADVDFRGNQFLSDYVVPDEVLAFLRKEPPGK